LEMRGSELIEMLRKDKAWSEKELQGYLEAEAVTAPTTGRRSRGGSTRSCEEQEIELAGIAEAIEKLDAEIAARGADAPVGRRARPTLGELREKLERLKATVTEQQSEATKAIEAPTTGHRRDFVAGAEKRLASIRALLREVNERIEAEGADAPVDKRRGGKTLGAFRDNLKRELALAKMRLQDARSAGDSKDVR